MASGRSGEAQGFKERFVPGITSAQETDIRVTEKESDRVHKEDSVGCSVEDTVGILVASELKANGVRYTSFQTHRLRGDHKPEDKKAAHSSHRH